MLRNTKAACLALCAALAITAVSAQGASAAVEHTFKCGSASCFTTAEGHPQARVQRLAIGETVVECSELHLTGHSV